MLRRDRRALTLIFWLSATFAFLALIAKPSFDSVLLVVAVSVAGLLLYKSILENPRETIQTQETDRNRAQLRLKDWLLIGVCTFLPPYLEMTLDSHANYILAGVAGFLGLFFSLFFLVQARYSKAAKNEDARRSYDS